MALSKKILDQIKKDFHYEEVKAEMGDPFAVFAKADYAVYRLVNEIERLKNAANDRPGGGQTGGSKGSADSK